jgi:hypothetical protein
VVVDAGPHPNPRKAAEGYRLRILAIDEPSAEVVRRIFAEYLDGRGDRAIANNLNRDAVQCPSARRPDQNRHRLADGWQGSTVRAILENPRYTGYAFFGRWAKHETLLDPDDVAAGHVIRFRRASSDRVVRSRQPAHPAIVSVEIFTQTQLLRRSKATGGLATARKADRGGRATARDYVLRGLMRCGVCHRKMQGATIRHGTYYRCTARTLAPGAAALIDHPSTVNLREDVVLQPLNDWIGLLFARENIDQTVAALAASQGGVGGTSEAREGIKARLTKAEVRLRRLQAAIEAGVDPAAVVEGINQAQAERAATKAELENTSVSDVLSDAEIYAMIDSLGDVSAALAESKPTSLSRLYQQLRLQLRYDPQDQAVFVTAQPRVDSARVRGGTRTRVRGIPAQGRYSCDRS